MTPPKFIGKVVYFCGYPIFRLLIRGSHRTYVVITLNDSVLVTKNWLGFQKKWRLPGGGLQAGESVRSAAQRELVEELGINIDESKFRLLTDEPIRHAYNYKYDLFALQLKTAPVMRVDNREIITAEFITKKALKNQLLSEELTVALSLM